MRNLCWALVAACLAAGGALAQTKGKDAKEAAPAPLAKSAAADKAATPPSSEPPPPVQPAAPMPNEYRLNLLIRTTIVALNQANQTGNYTVLRDLASPGFQVSNNAAKLAEVFADLRKSGFDLAPVLFYDPKLVRPAAIDSNGLLRLTGFFDTRPQRVHFDLAFQEWQGLWRLFGVNVETRLAPPETAQGATPPAAATPAAAKDAKASTPAKK